MKIFAVFLQFSDMAVLWNVMLFKTHASGLEMMGGGGGSQIGHRWVTSHKHHLVLVSGELKAPKKSTVT